VPSKLLSSLSPLLQLPKAKRGRTAFPAAISPALFLSSGRRAVAEGDASGNRCADVYRVGNRLPRSRVCLLLVDGEARVCRGVVLPRRALLGGVGVARALTSLWNKLSPPLLRPGGVLLHRQWRGPGDLHGSPEPAHLRLHQVRLLLACFCLDAVQFVGAVVASSPDLALSSLDSGSRRWRVQIWGLEELGRVPGQ
jgi:hypothetical protein